MIHIDNSKLEMKGETPLIEAETLSIMTAWIMSLNEECGIERALDYIKSTRELLSSIVKYIKEGENVNMACLKATRDMLKEIMKND